MTGAGRGQMTDRGNVPGQAINKRNSGRGPARSTFIGEV